MEFPGHKFAKSLVDNSLKAIDEFEKRVSEINAEEKLKNRKMIKWFIAIVFFILAIGYFLTFLVF